MLHCEKEALMELSLRRWAGTLIRFPPYNFIEPSKNETSPQLARYATRSSAAMNRLSQRDNNQSFNHHIFDDIPGNVTARGYPIQRHFRPRKTGVRR